MKSTKWIEKKNPAEYTDSRWRARQVPDNGLRVTGMVTESAAGILILL